MRIIENNYNAHTEYERDCPRCNSKFAFSFGDLKMDSVTLSHYIECPCCGFDISLNSEEVDDEETPTINTVQYPRDFYSYADGVSVKDTEINEWVKGCISDLDKDTDFSYRASGDAIVFAYKSGEDLPAATVIVAKQYEETDVKIPRKNF
jgi:hypothetical protein